MTDFNPYLYLNEVGGGEQRMVFSETPTNRTENIDTDEHSKIASSDSLENFDKKPRGTIDIIKFFAEETNKNSCKEEGQHQLPSQWTFWFLRPPQGLKSNQENFESLLKDIGVVSTAEEFWAVYLSLKRTDELTNGTTDYSLFRTGIRPVWEDPANSEGGKLVIRLKKSSSVSSRLWELLILSLVGEKEVPASLCKEICGAVFSIRPYENIISIWTKHAQEMTAIQSLREYIRVLFGLKIEDSLEYKPHTFSKPTN